MSGNMRALLGAWPLCPLYLSITVGVYAGSLLLLKATLAAFSQPWYKSDRHLTGDLSRCAPPLTLWQLAWAEADLDKWKIDDGWSKSKQIHGQNADSE